MLLLYIHRALQESLLSASCTSRTTTVNDSETQNELPVGNQSFQDEIDSNLALAIKLSQAEARKLEEDRNREQTLLDEVLRLSLEEK